MEGLHVAVVHEMQQGYRPTYRGHEWSKEHFDALTAAAFALEAAWHLLKWAQTPEMGSRLVEARREIQKLHSSLNAAMMLPTSSSTSS